MGGTLLLTQLPGSDGAHLRQRAGRGLGDRLRVAGPRRRRCRRACRPPGRIPNGAIVQQEIAGAPDQLRSMLELKNPDYATAVRIVDAINAYSRGAFPSARRLRGRQPHGRALPSAQRLVRALHGGDRRVAGPAGHGRARRARRAHGTVVVGQDVQISTVAVTYGTLTVRVNEQPQVSQPNPFANGRTVVTPNTTINAEQTGGPIAIVGGSSLRALVGGLNRIGVKPPGIIAILQAIKTAGALQADLVDPVGGAHWSAQRKPPTPTMPARFRGRHDVDRPAPVLTNVRSPSPLGVAALSRFPAPAQDGTPPEASEAEAARRPKSPLREKPSKRTRTAIAPMSRPSIAEARIAWQTKRLARTRRAGQAAHRRSREGRSRSARMDRQARGADEDR